MELNGEKKNQCIMIFQFSLIIIICLSKGDVLPQEDFDGCDNKVCSRYSDNEFLISTTPENDIYTSTETSYGMDKDYINSSGDGEKEFYAKTKRNITENEIHGPITTNVDSATEVTTSSTTEIDEKFILKINFSTTQIPPSKYGLLQNVTSDTQLCLCDLTLNQCDINCCCDKECNQLHYRVFTACSNHNDNENSYYCHSSNFLFRNNTSLKVVKNKNSLFCIVKDNSKIDLSYKTKSIIKSLQDFNKSYNKSHYSFKFKNLKRHKFTISEYRAGLPVWILQNREITEFGIPSPSFGYFCNSELKLKYLVDQITKCSYQLSESECGSAKLKKYFEYLKNFKIISNPGGVNKSTDLSKICESSTCLNVTSNLCYSSSVNLCIRVTEKMTEFGNIGCWNTVPKIQYLIAHNGSEGIKKFEVYVWLDNTSKRSDESFLQTIEIKYSWMGQPQKSFKRSGNPGYITGKPLLAGTKVYYLVNSTGEKKEAIQLSFDSKDWLTVLGSEKGVCSSEKRIPVNFRENSHHSCLLPFTKELFNKEKCKDLQHNIFKFLVGNEILNATNENYLNKFVATFGNSKVEETGDWVQVLIDLFPVTSSQVGFKYNYNNLICKNVITDLYIDVVYARFGSFTNPQFKVIGVSFRFGSHKDIIFSCNAFSCENSSFIQYTKLSTIVNFLDESESPNDAFALPLGLEIKLPHDFFYPFFSSSSDFHSSSILILSAFVFAFV